MSQFYQRALLILFLLAWLVTYAKNNTLATRVAILEASLASLKKSAAAPALPAPVAQEETLIRRVCYSLKGRVTESGQKMFCDVGIQNSLPPARVAASEPRRREAGGGIEVHYPNRSQRQCVELTGEAKCDPVTSAVTCPQGVHLVRAAPTTDGRGIRNRYVCN